MFVHLRSLWLRAGRWPRLVAAATCLLLAASSALGAARDRAAARTPHTVAVVVATRPLPAGHVLHDTDLRVEHWPVALDPPVTPSRTRALLGRRCAGALDTGEPLTPARVLGAGIATGLAAGLGALPIPVTGGRSAEYVRAGDHVDVLAGPPPDTPAGATGPATARVVAGRATVLSVLPGAQGEATVVIVAADRATALRVTGLGSVDAFTVVISP